jgi:cholesterol oxidase
MIADYDYVVIGSGFGGSVASLRLAEKGYSVCIIEKGRRFGKEDFPETNWKLWKWFWLPRIHFSGIQQLSLLNDVLILSGTGVGGGSLVYCAVLLEPPDSFYQDPVWAGLGKDWKSTLAPFYKKAREMLGVGQNPRLWESDKILQDYAKEIGREDHFKPTEVGIFFGEPGVTVPDPYFNGKGPERTGCDHKGHCMVGCKNGGKNSLDRNYLYLAENLGVKIIPETEAIGIEQGDNGEYLVATRRSMGLFRGGKNKIKARGVVMAAGALGTNKLLMECKRVGTLPKLSDQLGKVGRTNSEVLAGARARSSQEKYCQGIAITSSLFVDDVTHIEPVRYPEGSNAMYWLSSLATDGGSRIIRPLKYMLNCLTHPMDFFRSLSPFGFARKAVILLVMQTLDNRLEFVWKRRFWFPFCRTLTSKSTEKRTPSYIPAANEAAKGVAKRINGMPINAITEVLFNIPISAHILGGCVMGKDKNHGVVNSRGEVFGYENMYIVDGSIIPANLGVNPSLTITALAEYILSKIAKKE